MNWKRVTLVAGFIAVVIGIGYALYAIFLRPSIPTTIPEQPNANTNATPSQLPSSNINSGAQVNINTGTLPPSGAVIGTTPRPPAAQNITTISDVARGGLTKTVPITSTSVAGTTLDKNGINLNYYDRATGLFYKVSDKGVSTPLSDKRFFQVQKITWSTGKNEAILEYPDGANIMYNFDAKTQITLPQHWEDFNYSPTGQQIIFKSIGTGSETNWLAIAKNDGSQAQKIENLGDKNSNVYPLWSPNNQIAALYTEPRSENRQNLFFVGLNGENFKSSVIEGYGFQGKWSPQGDKLLYSVYSDSTNKKPTLWLTTTQGDAVGTTRRQLKIETWADKCSFSGDNELYCAVPRNLPDGAGIFNKDFQGTSSDIFKIDLKTGFKTLVATPDQNQPISSVFTSSDNRYLYFVAQNTGKIYQIKLRP